MICYMSVSVLHCHMSVSVLHCQALSPSLPSRMGKEQPLYRSPHIEEVKLLDQLLFENERKL